MERGRFGVRAQGWLGQVYLLHSLPADLPVLCELLHRRPDFPLLGHALKFVLGQILLQISHTWLITPAVPYQWLSAHGSIAPLGIVSFLIVFFITWSMVSLHLWVEPIPGCAAIVIFFRNGRVVKNIAFPRENWSLFGGSFWTWLDEAGAAVGSCAYPDSGNLSQANQDAAPGTSHLSDPETA